MKRFFYKIFDKNNTYLATWLPYVADKPQFSWEINGGLKQLTIKLIKKINNFGENEDVKLGNKVECWIKDKESGAKGQKIYSGWISSYELVSKEQSVIVTCQSYATTLKDNILKNGSATTVTYNSYDPSSIFRNILTLYNGVITYTPSSVQDTGTKVSYTFKCSTVKDALSKCLELCPVHWYFYFDANNIAWLKHTDFETIDHTLYLKKHCSSFSMRKNLENMVNAYYFLGGGEPQLYKKYERQGSIDVWGRREKLEQDERVTVESTADIMATSYLDAYDAPQIEVELEVLDSNGESDKGYDIESLKPGDIVRIIDPSVSTHYYTLWDVAEWDVDYWDYNLTYALNIPMQIQNINYAYDKAQLTLSTRMVDITKRIEDIKRNLEGFRNENIPTTPTT